MKALFFGLTATMILSGCAATPESPLFPKQELAESCRVAMTDYSHCIWDGLEGACPKLEDVASQKCKGLSPGDDQQMDSPEFHEWDDILPATS